MRNKITFFLKNNNFISTVYFMVGSLFVRFLKLFVNSDRKAVLFVSYGGKQFSDSPKKIYDYMKSDPRFSDWRLVWAFVNPSKFKAVDSVKIDTIGYFKLCLSAGTWVTNSGVKRYLNFTPHENFFVNTWHGIPIKKIGIDEKNVKKSKIFARKWFEFANANVNLYHTDYDLQILKHVFDADISAFQKFGLPRNDDLYNKNYPDKTIQVKKRLGIDSDKKVILYAPTVRGNLVNSDDVTYFKPPFDFQKWQEQFPNVVFLYRAHYFVGDTGEVNNVNVINTTNYPNLNELMDISDLMISDYSSVFFDYSILRKPMYCFAYDYEQYIGYQGLYMNIKKELPNIAFSEDELMGQIKRLDLTVEKNKTQDFFSKYVDGHGDATKKVVDLIYSHYEQLEDRK